LLIAINNNENATKLLTFVDIDNNKYCNKKREIIETKTLKNFEYYSILLAKKTKKFVKQKTKSNARFREKYKTRYIVRNKMFASFSIVQKNKKDLVYKKETSRKKCTLIKQEIKN